MSVSTQSVSEWKIYDTRSSSLGYGGGGVERELFVKCNDPRTVGDRDLDPGSSDTVTVWVQVSNGAIYYGTVANSHADPYHALWVLQKDGDKYEYVTRVRGAHMMVDTYEQSRTITYIKNYVYEKVISAPRLRRQYVRQCARMLALVKRKRATVGRTVAGWELWEMVFGSSDTSFN